MFIFLIISCYIQLLIPYYLIIDENYLIGNLSKINILQEEPYMSVLIIVVHLLVQMEEDKVKLSLYFFSSYYFKVYK